MAAKPTYEELEKRVKELEREAARCRKAEEAVLESEERLRTVLDSIQTGVAVIDAENHVIVDVNPVAIELIGAPREKIVGHVCHKFVCPAEEGNCPITDLGQTVDKSERVLINAEGESIPVLKTVVPIILAGRRHILESFMDITDRKRAEEALEEREERLRAILNSVQAGIVTIDAESHKIVDVNPVAVKMIGIPKEQIIGRACNNFICPPEDGKCPITDLGQTIDQSERQLLIANGKTVPVLKTVASVFLDGRKHLIESFLDITERKRAEEERQRLIEKLQQALAEVKTLSGLLPICSSCKKIRDDKGYWNQIEAYIRDHSEAEFSHGICPECAKKLYPDLNIYDEKEQSS